MMRKVTVKGGVIEEVDQLDTLLNALPQKYDMMREAYFVQIPVPNINYVWDRMYDIESTEKRRAVQYGASALGAKGYQGTRGRGRGNQGGRRGGFGGRRVTDRVETENCFRCGDTDHWSRECPRK